MLRIKKRSGAKAEFDRKKLEKSVRSAGGNAKVAKTVADETEHHEGMDTLDLRRLVIAQLKIHDKDVGNRYEAYRKHAFRAR